MDIHSRLLEVAQRKGLRQSTVFSYRRLLMRLGIADDSVSLEDV
ncbi:MAG: hypothetical protein JWR28_1114, partial [Modestobacter sp.]|nr:hypothetical protein [Modestobacter sp.]